MNETLEILDIQAGVEGRDILRGVSFTARAGEVHAIMGPNGSGKSTLAGVIMGHPKYKVTKGDIRFGGRSIMAMQPDERAKAGLFLSFQYPFEIQGLSFSKFLHAAYKAQNPLDTSSVMQFRAKMNEAAKQLKMGQDFVDRELNVGFSGGEKKRAEILQLLVLRPKMAILDETDSGLDIDSLKLVSEAVNGMRSKDFGAVVITHYTRILNYLKPDFVHVMYEGRIVKSGGHELAELLEKKGYVEVLKEAGIRTSAVKLA